MHSHKLRQLTSQQQTFIYGVQNDGPFAIPYPGCPLCPGVQRRQDVDLSVAAQLRALRDYADKNGYSVAREYVDEAESGRVANRPQFRRMLDEAAKPEAPFSPNPPKG